MKIKSLSYILIESTNLESWEVYARDVVGLMKNDDLSDENNLFFRMDESPFRFQVQTYLRVIGICQIKPPKNLPLIIILKQVIKAISMKTGTFS